MGGQDWIGAFQIGNGPADFEYPETDRPRTTLGRAKTQFDQLEIL